MSGVYELWSGDTCLYVGMSVNPARRVTDHRRSKPWWPEVTDVRITECDDYEAAGALECRTIFRLRPKHNLQWNPDYDRTLLDRAHLFAALPTERVAS